MPPQRPPSLYEEHYPGIVRKMYDLYEVNELLVGG